MTDFSIQSFKGGFDKNLSYILNCMRTGFAIIIDAAISPEKLIPFLKKDPTIICITHSHHDHIMYIEEYIKNFPKIKIVGHPKSKNVFDCDKFIAVEDYSKIKIGNLEIKPIFTPGHYYDSICYLIENVIFTGDTLFVGRTGRIKGKKSDINKLYDSIYNKILKLPPDTYIYPGHDYGELPSITLKENIKISNLLGAKNKTDFIFRMNEYEKYRKIRS